MLIYCWAGLFLASMIQLKPLPRRFPRSGSVTVCLPKKNSNDEIQILHIIPFQMRYNAEVLVDELKSLVLRRTRFKFRHVHLSTMESNRFLRKNILTPNLPERQFQRWGSLTSHPKNDIFNIRSWNSNASKWPQLNCSYGYLSFELVTIPLQLSWMKIPATVFTTQKDEHEHVPKWWSTYDSFGFMIPPHPSPPPQKKLLNTRQTNHYLSAALHFNLPCQTPPTPPQKKSQHFHIVHPLFLSLLCHPTSSHICPYISSMHTRSIWDVSSYFLVPFMPF